MIDNSHIHTTPDGSVSADIGAAFSYAATAHNLQACRTYKSVWLEYAPKPLTQKDTFYKQNEAALQAYSRAASQLDRMEISQLVEPEKLQLLVSETENRIVELVAELEKVQKADKAVQESKEVVKQIQSGEVVTSKELYNKQMPSYTAHPTVRAVLQSVLRLSYSVHPAPAVCFPAAMPS